MEASSRQLELEVCAAISCSKVKQTICACVSPLHVANIFDTRFLKRQKYHPCMCLVHLGLGAKLSIPICFSAHVSIMRYIVLSEVLRLCAKCLTHEVV